MIRWPFYPAELIAYAAAFVLALLVKTRRLPGYRDVSLVLVPIALKMAWSAFLCFLAWQARGDITPAPNLATIHQALTFLMGLALASLFAKRLWGRHE